MGPTPSPVREVPVRPRFQTLAIIVCLLPALTVAAQNYGPALGTLRLSFDPDNTQRRIEVPAMGVFDWYVAMELDLGSSQQNAQDGLLIWEGGLALPPEIVVLSAEHLPELAFCDACSSSDWRALLGRCLLAEDTPATLMHFQGQLLQDVDDLQIELRPALPSNFDGVAPGWRSCIYTGNPDELHPFEGDWPQSIWVNSSVGRTHTSWSTLKGRY